MGVTAAVLNTDWARSVLSIRGVDVLAGLAGNLMPYVLVVAAFTFVYAFIPNTRVRPVAAFVGGLVGGVLWQSAGWAFAAFIASSTRYAAIYSGFAIVILFMIWLYVSWLTVLFGASVAFYCQHPYYLLPLAGEPRLSNRMREYLALAVAVDIGAQFAAGRPGPTLQQLGQMLRVPHHGLQGVLQALLDADVIALSSTNHYLPARDLQGVSVHALLRIVREAGEGRYVRPDDVAFPDAVRATLERSEQESERLLGEVSIASLAAQVASPGGTGAD
jgi:membrane protein